MIVTLVGWITLVELFFLFLPPELEAGFFLRQLPMKNLNAWFVLVKPDHGVAAKAVQDGEIVDGVDFFVGETAGFGWMCRAGAASDVRQGESLRSSGIIAQALSLAPRWVDYSRAGRL